MPLTRPLPVFTAGREKQAGPQRTRGAAPFLSLTVQLEKDVYLHCLQKLILDCTVCHCMLIRFCLYHRWPMGPTERQCARLSICSCRGRITFWFEKCRFKHDGEHLSCDRSNICPVCKSL
ncbi:hypothetical protein GOODEAATRI_026703 [Goodea atripinnis]|uniref:Uncharacterized protein n=1 Tax=Goodea atripinnis TaxID=208336 RepID=A0ABV0MVM7_9TELE